MKHKKTSQLLLALLVLGGTFLISEKVYADVIYTQSQGHSVTERTTSNWVQLGSFISPINGLISSGNSVFCIESDNHPVIILSTTNDVNASGALTGNWDYISNDGETGCFTKANTGFNTALVSGNTYYIMGTGADGPYNYDYYNDGINIEGFITSASDTPPIFSSNITRFTYISPFPNTEISTTTTTGQIYSVGATTTLAFETYINPDDYSSDLKIVVTFENISNNLLNPQSSFFYFPVTNSGIFSVSTTTAFLPPAEYKVYAEIRNNLQDPVAAICGVAGTWIGNLLSIETNTCGFYNSTTTNFFIGQTSLSQNTTAQSQGEATAEIININNVGDTTPCDIDFDFSITTCLGYLFIPTGNDLSDIFTSLKTDVLTHFPLGYVTDIFNIMLTASSTPLTVVDAYVPNALPFGQNQHIRLDLNGVLDPYLNATTGVFMNESASSSQTLFEITNRYWKYILYILTIFYVLRRLMGARIIPPYNTGGNDQKNFKMTKK